MDLPRYLTLSAVRPGCILPPGAIFSRRTSARFLLANCYRREILPRNLPPPQNFRVSPPAHCCANVFCFSHFSHSVFAFVFALQIFTTVSRRCSTPLKFTTIFVLPALFFTLLPSVPRAGENFWLKFIACRLHFCLFSSVFYARRRASLFIPTQKTFTNYSTLWIFLASVVISV